MILMLTASPVDIPHIHTVSNISKKMPLSESFSSQDMYPNLPSSLSFRSKERHRLQKEIEAAQKGSLLVRAFYIFLSQAFERNKTKGVCCYTTLMEVNPTRKPKTSS
jgi:hypothetical protein